jgi:ABC-type amino acid transport substrate-binding protein
MRPCLQFCLAVVLLMLCACGDEAARKATPSTLERVLASRVLRCGYIPYPPYFEKDLTTDAPQGLMVDVMTRVAAKLDVTLEWTAETGWATLTEDLKAGRFDAVCSAVWAVPVRATQASFSMPVMYAPVYVWARASDARFDDDLGVLNDSRMRISTLDGDANQGLALDLFPKATMIELPQNASMADYFMNVTTNKADIVFAEPRMVTDFLKTHPGALHRVNGGQALMSYPLAVVLPQHQEDFKTAIDTALAQVVYTRALDDLLVKNGFAPGDVLRPKLPY